jgi:hypothetical protein
MLMLSGKLRKGGQMQSTIRKAVACSLWFVLAAAFDWAELKLFHSRSGIGLTLGIITGGFIGYVINGPRISN